MGCSWRGRAGMWLAVASTLILLVGADKLQSQNLEIPTMQFQTRSASHTDYVGQVSAVGSNLWSSGSLWIWCSGGRKGEKEGPSPPDRPFVAKLSRLKREPENEAKPKSPKDGA
ncbi:hypothetical protein ASPVEDRAFT_346988 [Aspergillus versicolor CBS 583.65]|uniref:Uncharacterized protein n=1 Tax=Aspergillus versicolor CBS 583.65 TaxID=1036611 RepID=A0A1L9PZI0_ASPVE|nr:uncharacterized protein ASPVEDRAFT_346988 [Aspergillus versicolor CBS 583.65]OJJ06927.1 hypothetical protein ASPVEDRAFT_346988 [Aspergillus versicolor CBS 583.65]